MSDKSAIAWTDATWNPVTGCTRVSPGCAHCYAYALHDKRHAANERAAQIAAGFFDEGERHIRGDEGWGQYAERVGAPPEGWSARARNLSAAMPFPPTYDRPFSTVQLHPERLDAPLHWRKPRRVFVNSMSDLFHEQVPDEFIDRVFAVMALTPWHTYQVLTKRPERMLDYLVQEIPNESAHVRVTWHALGLCALPTRQLGRGVMLRDDGLLKAWPLPNVHLGVSVENQRWADVRIPLLLHTPAAVRFLSCEPLLEPLTLSLKAYADHGQFIDWVIAGGESGPGHRELDLAWAKSLRDQCLVGAVPFFFKQASGPGPGRPSGDPSLDGCKEFPK